MLLRSEVRGTGGVDFQGQKDEGVGDFLFFDCGDDRESNDRIAADIE
jgi:hypothetical protein